MCFLISLLLSIYWLWFQFDTCSDPLFKKNDLQRFRSVMSIATTRRCVDAQPIFQRRRVTAVKAADLSHVMCLLDKQLRLQNKGKKATGQTTRPLTIYPVYFVFSKLLKCGILSLCFLFCRLQLIYQIRMWLITYLWVYPRESHTLTCRAETSTWTVLLDT